MVAKKEMMYRPPKGTNKRGRYNNDPHAHKEHDGGTESGVHSPGHDGRVRTEHYRGNRDNQ